MEQENKKYYYIMVVAAILSLGLIISSIVATIGLVKVKARQNTIIVTGSAKKQIKADYVVWRGSFSSQAVKQIDAYNTLKVSLEKVKAYLKAKGINEKDMVFTSISTITNYEPSYNGQISNKVESYRLMQNVEIKSNDVDKLTEISRKITELINDGVEFQSYPPEYFYTKIADLKVDMLGLATLDAKVRADQIAKNTGIKIGNLKSAKMGVFQITPLYSTEVSDYGINDTSSIDKEITAVINCEFEIK